MLKDLIVVGASGFGREVVWLVERINRMKPTWNLLGFLDDDVSKVDTYVNGYRVLGTVSSNNKYKNAYFICAIGASKVRKRIINKLGDVKYASLIDPGSVVSDKVQIGEGVIICAGTIVTVNVKIGNHVVINLNCTIGHDAILHDFVTLYPSVNLSGYSEIGKCTELGTGAQIIQNKIIGEKVIIGAGAVVVDNISANCTAVGIPAKVIKQDC